MSVNSGSNPRVETATPHSIERRGSSSSTQRSRLFIVAIGLTLFLLVLLRTAWVCDDAYITFRTVDNFVHGYGLTWNVSERVQSYTNPLWMMVFTAIYAVTHEAYFTSIALSIVISLLAVFVVASTFAETRGASVVVFAALLSSKAFVDFSTSGLENALMHLLIVTLLWVYWRGSTGPRRLFQLTLIASLCLLNRLDLIFLLAPLLLVESARVGIRAGWTAVLAGAAPLIAWEIFATIYYGFPLPNTAYAKLLGADVSHVALFRRGMFYAFATGLFDPATIAIIVAAPLTIIGARRWRDWPLVVGLIVHGLYVTSVGGDFMYGRFFTPLVVWSVALFARAEWLSSTRIATAVASAVLVLGVLAADEPALFSGNHAWTPFPRYQWFAGEAIDERKQFFATTGMFNQTRGEIAPHHEWALQGVGMHGRHGVIVLGAIGFAGYFAGPTMHIIDEYGLADPLLARLPPYGTDRIGHFIRTVPKGYEQTIATGVNHIDDPALAKYYDRLHEVVSGPVWRRERLLTVTAMLLGRYDASRDSYVRRYRRTK